MSAPALPTALADVEGSGLDGKCQMFWVAFNKQCCDSWPTQVAIAIVIASQPTTNGTVYVAKSVTT